MNELKLLQSWYASKCDGDWEHSYGLSLQTLDNPGWSLEIYLIDTDIFEKPFDIIQRGDNGQDADWILCKVEGGKFLGYGGSRNLTELISTFLTWATANLETNLPLPLSSESGRSDPWSNRQVNQAN